MQQEVKNYEAILDRPFELTSTDNPRISYIDEQGRKMMHQPVALSHWREYAALKPALIRSAAAIAAKASDVLLRHEQWLRSEFEAGILEGISTKLAKIQQGVLDLDLRREVCLQLKWEFEQLADELLPAMQVREEIIKTTPQGDFVTLDMPVDDLREVKDILMEFAEEIAY